MENETAPQQKKGPKSQKIKPPNPRKALFPRILAVFHCINFGVAMFIGTVKLIQFNDAPPPNLITMHPLANGLKSAFLHNKCTPFRVCIRECRYTVPATEQTVLFQNPIGDSHHQMYFYIYGIQPKNKFNHDYYNLTLPFSTSSRNLSTSFFVSLDLP